MAVIETRQARLRREAATLEHQLHHIPKNEECPACQQAKAVQERADRQEQDLRTAKNAHDFGDLLLADHVVLIKSFNFGIQDETSRVPNPITSTELDNSRVDHYLRVSLLHLFPCANDTNTLTSSRCLSIRTFPAFPAQAPGEPC